MSETISWIGGVIELKPIEYRVTETISGPWWWKNREYWIECEYSRCGPFESASEARRTLALVAR